MTAIMIPQKFVCEKQERVGVSPMRRGIGWEHGKLNSSTTFAQSIKCIIIDWDIGSARDCAGAQGKLT